VGGQRSERKKWVKVMSDRINAILYVAAVSEYDMQCFEDHKTLRIHEALQLFQLIVDLKFLDRKTVIIFFNKYDLFLDKIKKVPITVAFGDFDQKTDGNPNDAVDVLKFLQKKFLAVFDGKQAKLASPVHIHYTTALDTQNISKVYQDVQLDLVNSNLGVMGMV